MALQAEHASLRQCGESIRRDVVEHALELLGIDPEGTLVVQFLLEFNAAADEVLGEELFDFGNPLLQIHFRFNNLLFPPSELQDLIDHLNQALHLTGDFLGILYSLLFR